MNDPVEKMRQIVKLQRERQAREDAARAVWCGKIPDLERVAQAVVLVLKQSGPPMIWVEARSDQILVGFHTRQAQLVAGGEHARRAGRTPETEDGAVCEFHFDPNSFQVLAWRKPFRTADRPWETFRELGDPDALTPEDFGNAVADFLDWGAFGEGRGSGKLRL